MSRLMSAGGSVVSRQAHLNDSAVVGRSARRSYARV